MENASWQPTEIRITDSARRVKTCAYSLSKERQRVQVLGGWKTQVLCHADVNCMQGFLANLGSLCVSSHAVRMCENPKSPIMNR